MYIFNYTVKNNKSTNERDIYVYCYNNNNSIRTMLKTNLFDSKLINVDQILAYRNKTISNRVIKIDIE